LSKIQLRHKVGEHQTVGSLSVECFGHHTD